MNDAGVNDTEQAVSEKIAADAVALGGWTQSLWSRMGSSLKKSSAKIQDAVSSPAQPGQAVTERAEASLDRTGERLGVFAASLSYQVRRSAALVREEAEDMLAEAQSLRQKEQA